MSEQSLLFLITIHLISTSEDVESNDVLNAYPQEAQLTGLCSQGCITKLGDILLMTYVS
jgi:hypothetical protein